MKDNPKINTKLLQEIQDILSQKFQTEIKIKSTITLSEELRRNLVIRIILEKYDSNIPQTVIFKQSLLDKEAQDDASVLARFARDWAGLEFISSLTLRLLLHQNFMVEA
jgi:hypothetical protein